MSNTRTLKFTTSTGKSFLLTGPSSLASDLTSQLPQSDWINVKAYGAAGDWTTNDTDAILAAYAALPSTGGTLYFPRCSSSYRMNQGYLSILKNNVRMVGEGGATIKGSDGATQASWLIRVGDGTTMTTDFEMGGMTLDGNRENSALTGSSSAHLLDIVGAQRVWIERNHFKSSPGDCVQLAYAGAALQTNQDVYIGRNFMDGGFLRNGISIVRADRVFIGNWNIIDGYNTVGIDIEPDGVGAICRNIEVTENFVKPAATHLNGYNSNRLVGISVNMPGNSDDESNINVHENFVVGVTDTLQFPLKGIQVVKSRAVSIQGNKVFQVRRGIETSGNTGTTGPCIVTENHVWLCKEMGIVAGYSTICTDNVSELNDESGIWLYHPNSNCRGNTCRNNGQGASPTWPYGIYVRHPGVPGNNIVRDNRCYDDQTPKTQTYGIFFETGAISNTCTDNDVAGNATAGISPPAALADNKILQNKGYNVTETNGTAAPTSGTWAVGDICWNTAPAAAGILAWVCTTAGTPGTWSTVSMASQNPTLDQAYDAGRTITADAGDLEIVGDIDADGGYRQTIDGWFQADVAANQTTVLLGRSGTYTSSFQCIRAGSITGASVRTNNPRTAGTCALLVYLNNLYSGMACGLNAGNTTHAENVGSKGFIPFAAGDYITVKVTTDSGWLPTTADIEVQVEIET